MTVSAETKKRLAVAVTSLTAATELIAAIDAQGSGPAVAIAAIGTTTNLPAPACAGVAAPTAAQVDTAINTVKAVVETRLDAIEAKVDSLIAALKAAQLMAAA